MVVVVKPRQLMFESFPGFSEWAYFRPETDQLAPSGAYKKSAGTYEEVLELTPGEYLPRTIYDEGFQTEPQTGQQIPLPPTARVVTRQLQGSFVVFAKASHFNEIDSYQGKHNRFTTDDFRNEIEKIVRAYGHKLREAAAKRKHIVKL